MANEPLTIGAIGDSSCVVLPQQLLEEMNLTRGDKLFATRTPDGILLRTYDETFAKQMKVAGDAMKRRRNVLRDLAK